MPPSIVLCIYGCCHIAVNWPYVNWTLLPQKEWIKNALIETLDNAPDRLRSNIYSELQITPYCMAGPVPFMQSGELLRPEVRGQSPLRPEPRAPCPSSLGVSGMVLRGRTTQFDHIGQRPAASALERPAPSVPCHPRNIWELGMAFDGLTKNFQHPKLAGTPRHLGLVSHHATLGPVACIRARAIQQITHAGLTELPKPHESWGHGMSFVSCKKFGFLADRSTRRPLRTQGTYVDAQHGQSHKIVGSGESEAGSSFPERKLEPVFFWPEASE
jgi:hypothetical protein